MRIHCGKHDKIYDDATETCPGCDTERMAENVAFVEALNEAPDATAPDATAPVN